jgi:energy-coupling factor transport system substrate-specific component
MDSLVGQRSSGHGLRFLIAGGFATLVNWLIRFPLSTFLPFEVAVAIAYAIGMIIGFALYSCWVFPPSPIPLAGQIARFIAVNAAGAAVVITTAPALASLIANGGLPLSIAFAIGHAVAIVFGAIVNYLGHKLITFAVPA